MPRAEERRPLVARAGVWRRRAACAAVLAVQALERAAFLGVAPTLVLRLGGLGWADAQASLAALLFLGASFVLAPLGGWTADAYLGRRRALVLSLGLYLPGLGLLLASAGDDARLALCGDMRAAPLRPVHARAPPPGPYCAAPLYGALLLTALAASSARVNLAAFGADQVRDLGRDATRRFFNWFYWSVNVGAVFALLVVAFVQQNIDFLLGYSLPLGCVSLAFFIFLFATPAFISKPPMGSQVSSMLKLALRGCCPWLRRPRSARHPQGVHLLPDQRVPQPGPSPQEDVANFQVLVKILPVMATLVPYWMVYFQMQSTYVLQGLRLHIPRLFPTSPTNTSAVLRAWASDYTIPEAWLLLANVVAVLILVPLKDHLLDPLLLRCQLLPSALQKMALGMFFGFTSVVVAGVLETERLRYVHRNETVPQVIGKDLHWAAPLSIWWQIPQYLLIGISEIFASIPGLEFAYGAAPRTMQSAILGIFFCLSGLGSLLGSGLVAVLSLPGGWMYCPTDAGNGRSCRMDLYFFLLAGIQAVTAALFIWIAQRYESTRQGSAPRPGPPTPGLTSPPRTRTRDTDSSRASPRGTF
ncbi:PREDICTED: solute carrier family 15 member 3 [Chinchilla lanigera]|uniref:solute carrier family 15 member 3 n=1 Tax=Chinchilla lanigera TaxID=34839 RepID=UPI000696D6BE|nr:PREDICTED: solute carrier family 15 member 3 [Chinchilla lanigera]